jgi:hypothetical protein
VTRKSGLKCIHQLCSQDVQHSDNTDIRPIHDLPGDKMLDFSHYNEITQISKYNKPILAIQASIQLGLVERRDPTNCLVRRRLLAQRPTVGSKAVRHQYASSAGGVYLLCWAHRKLSDEERLIHKRDIH